MDIIQICSCIHRRRLFLRIVVAITVVVLCYYGVRQLYVKVNEDFKKYEVLKENALEDEREHMDEDCVCNKNSLPSKQEMFTMSSGILEDLYQRYLNAIQILCKTPVRIGNRKDGGWDICTDKAYIQSNKCLVYSFGINNDFSFDDEIGIRYGCEVFSFDPSMKRPDHIRRRKPLISFHALGISNVNKNGTWRMLTYHSIREVLHHNELIPTIIKMDIEDSEWDVLKDILYTQSKLPRQLTLELHGLASDGQSDSRYWLKRLFILKDLYDKGYRIFWINRNLACVLYSANTSKYYYGCLEVSLICPKC